MERLRRACFNRSRPTATRSALCATILCLAWQWQLHFLWCHGFAEFSAIPICHGASASLNQLGSNELKDTGVKISAAKGRWYLHGCEKGSKLLDALRGVRHVRGIRRVVACVNCTTISEDRPHEVARKLDETADWHSALQDLEYLSEKDGRNISTFCVVCKQLPKLQALLENSDEFRQQLAWRLEERLGWSAVGRGRSPDLVIYVHVEGCFILLEIPILQQNQLMIGGSLPFQGMHHVEAWAIARCLDIQPGDLVLDPMCGSGTLLAEAAIWWPAATYLGCDVNGSQLERCRGNFAAVWQEVSLHQVDATQPGGIPLEDGSVDKIMVAPPWNRQFAISGRPQQFYTDMFRELFRVVHGHGRIVLFVSRRVLQRVTDALEASSSCWSLVEQRSFTVTRKTIGVILILKVVPKSENHKEPNKAANRLFWEGDAPTDGRDLYEYWRAVRARGFPRLSAAMT